jgi:hypothetical protein
MDLGEIGWGGVDSVVSGWGLVADSCECGDEPAGSGATALDDIDQYVLNVPPKLVKGRWRMRK